MTIHGGAVFRERLCYDPAEARRIAERVLNRDEPDRDERDEDLAILAREVLRLQGKRP